MNYMLNVNRLRMLREISARGTIVAAAEALYMTPSAISQQMAVLAREAGTPLLERFGRGVRLTDAGHGLVAHAERIFADMERAEADLAAASLGLVGTVRTAAFATAARTLLIPALPPLADAYPNLRVTMVDLEPQESLPALKSDQLDVVLSYEWNVLPDLDDPGIDREELLREPMYLVLPPRHRLAGERAVSIADLRDEEWVVWRGVTSMADLLVAATRKAGYEPRRDYQIIDLAVLLSAVEAGLGVALVPSLMFLGARPDVAIANVSDLELSRTIWACVRSGSRANPRIDAVLDALHASAERIAGRIPATAEEPPPVPQG
jgi:DNA-binding transcriptional LysR family regulator